jgi:hypothetical protein
MMAHYLQEEGRSVALLEATRVASMNVKLEVMTLPGL